MLHGLRLIGRAPIGPLSEYLVSPKTPAIGMTIREIISKIGKFKVLDLVRDDNLEETQNK